MTFAYIPDFFLRSLESALDEWRPASATAPNLQRRINLNERYLEKYMASAKDARVSDWHEPLRRERLVAILRRSADDYGDEVGSSRRLRAVCRRFRYRELRRVRSANLTSLTSLIADVNLVTCAVQTDQSFDFCESRPKSQLPRADL